MLTEENYSYSTLNFRDRQAGVSLVYDPLEEAYRYNAYCLEKKLIKELVSQEFEFLEDALNYVNEEFGNWQLEEFSEKKGCGNCAAK